MPGMGFETRQGPRKGEEEHTHRRRVKAHVEEDWTRSRLTYAEKEGVERSKERRNGGKSIGGRFVCLFFCCYATRKSILGFPPWKGSKPPGRISTRAAYLFLRSYQRYTTARKHSTCQLRLTLYNLMGWLASLDLRKSYTSLFVCFFKSHPGEGKWTEALIIYMHIYIYMLLQGRPGK